MRKESTIYDLRHGLPSRARDLSEFTIERRGSVPGFKSIVNRQSSIVNAGGFTMVEIAICLAIIGVALVAIIGVLPLGLRTQRDNREETIINQDATVFLEAIRNGARGLNDLTNYVYAVTNYWTLFGANGTVIKGGGTINNGYTFANVSIAPGYFRFRFSHQQWHQHHRVVEHAGILGFHQFHADLKFV